MHILLNQIGYERDLLQSNSILKVSDASKCHKWNKGKDIQKLVYFKQISFAKTNEESEGHEHGNPD